MVNLKNKSNNELTEKTLEEYLRLAEKEHDEYEKNLGKNDGDWPKWYARFIIHKLQE